MNTTVLWLRAYLFGWAALSALSVGGFELLAVRGEPNWPLVVVWLVAVAVLATLSARDVRLTLTLRNREGFTSEKGQ